MTTMFKILTVVAVLCLSRVSIANELNESLSVTIHTQAATLKSGDEVILYAAAKNLSNTDVTIMTPPRLGANFMVKMIRPGGKVQADKHLLAGSHGSVTLKFGEEVKEEISLSKKFDMSEPGEYIIQAGPVGPVPPDNLKVLAWSNPITLTIVK